MTWVRRLLRPERADRLAGVLTTYAGRVRQDAARKVCAREGHQWWGYNAYRGCDLDDKVHIRHCEREHCEASETWEGWR